MSNLITQHFGEDLEAIRQPIETDKLIEYLEKIPQKQQTFFNLLTAISNEDFDLTTLSLPKWWSLTNLPRYTIRDENGEKIIIIQDKLKRDIFAIDKNGYLFDNSAEITEDFFAEAITYAPESNTLYQMYKIFQNQQKEPTKTQLLETLIADK